MRDLEFTLGATDLKSVLSYENICMTFDYLDIDKSGKISASELQLRLGSHLDEAHYARILKTFDDNKDSEVRVELARWI
jgi:Ca2+-binding EF-hand superfamily protein